MDKVLKNLVLDHNHMILHDDVTQYTNMVRTLVVTWLSSGNNIKIKIFSTMLYSFTTIFSCRTLIAGFKLTLIYMASVRFYHQVIIYLGCLNISIYPLSVKKLQVL